MSERRRLFFDIETSPCEGYFWRPGYELNIPAENITREAAIICICYKWEGEKEIHWLHWDRNQSDKRLLQDFIKVANRADEIVGHNGDRFDIKWLRTRCMFHRIPAFPQYHSLDTLKKARSGFALNSNRLDYIGGYLGVGRKKVTKPGLWKDVMNKKPGALEMMVKYCQQDVNLLEKVYQVMRPYITHRTHMGVLGGGGYKHHCPNCGSEHTKRNKNKVTAAGTLQVQMLCLACKEKGKGTYWTMGHTTYINECRREEDKKNKVPSTKRRNARRGKAA